VGKPRVGHFRARWDGEMRAAPDAPWMSVRAEQHNFFTPPARLYLIRGARYGLPFEGLHIYSGANARMQIRLASIFDVADARGAKMDQSETVTLFNDMCLLAPATLIDPNIRWEVLDARSVRGTFTHAGHTISATLSFDEAGDLVSFTSGDRYLSADGETYLSFPWSTPVRGHRDYHGVRLAEHGDAVWKQPSGDYVYARFRLLDVEYNPGSILRGDEAPPPVDHDTDEGNGERHEPESALGFVDHLGERRRRMLCVSGMGERGSGGQERRNDGDRSRQDGVKHDTLTKQGPGREERAR
jgi:hypothetical protein